MTKVDINEIAERLQELRPVEDRIVEALQGETLGNGILALADLLAWSLSVISPESKARMVESLMPTIQGLEERYRATAEHGIKTH